MLLAGALQIVGALLLVVAASMVAAPLGVAVAALCLFSVGYWLEHR